MSHEQKAAIEGNIPHCTNELVAMPNENIVDANTGMLPMTDKHAKTVAQHGITLQLKLQHSRITTMMLLLAGPGLLLIKRQKVIIATQLGVTP